MVAQPQGSGGVQGSRGGQVEQKPMFSASIFGARCDSPSQERKRQISWLRLLLHRPMCNGDCMLRSLQCFSHTYYVDHDESHDTTASAARNWRTATSAKPARRHQTGEGSRGSGGQVKRKPMAMPQVAPFSKKRNININDIDLGLSLIHI